MIFNDDKRYYKERKTPSPIKKKIKKDIAKKNMQSFSYEDMLKETSLSKTVKPKQHKRTNKINDYVDNSYIKAENNKVTSSSVISVYGEDSSDGTANNISVSPILKSRFEQARTKNLGSKPEQHNVTKTIEQFVTDKVLRRKREEQKLAKPDKKEAKPTSYNFRKRKKSNPRENNEESQNTIDFVLSGIAVDEE